jgi:hypothetical protein
MSQENLEPLNPDPISSVHDASYGTMIEDLDQPLVLYTNREGSLKALHARLLATNLLAPLLIFSYLINHPERWWMAVCFMSILAFSYIVQRRYYSGAVLPVIEMNSTGLVLRTLHYNIAIPWNEIREVRAHRFIVWLIGIVPADTATTAARGTYLTQFVIWLNRSCIGFYRLFGVFVAPIELHASEFSISAEALAEQINLRRAHALQLAQQQNLDILPPT